MPTYDFRCKSCDHRFEVTRSFSEDGIPACPSCAEANGVVKVFPKVGISFKGSGFYKTDHGSKAKSSAGSSNSSSESSSSSSDSASKSESSSTKSESSSTKSDSSSSSSSSSAA
jgi:putative FmdB family regulatory protein